MSTHPRTRTGHDVWTLLGVGVVALAAAVMSFASLRDLAQRAGYTPALAALLPLAIDAQAVVATRAWLAAHTPERARRYARALALAAVAGSVAGNAGQHAMAAANAITPWWVVVAIASVPPIALAATAHLAALLATHRPATDPAEHAEDAATEPAPASADERVHESHHERSAERVGDAHPGAHTTGPVSAHDTTHTDEAVSAQPSRTTARKKPQAKRSPKGQARARALFEQHAEAGSLDQLTGTDIAHAGAVSPQTGRRWLAAWRTEHDEHRPQLAVVGVES